MSMCRRAGALPQEPIPARRWPYVLLALGFVAAWSVTVLLAALYVFGQRDIKRLLAYSWPLEFGGGGGT